MAVLLERGDGNNDGRIFRESGDGGPGEIGQVHGSLRFEVQGLEFEAGFMARARCGASLDYGANIGRSQEWISICSPLGIFLAAGSGCGRLSGAAGAAMDGAALC
jgi:hypothetical protein